MKPPKSKIRGEKGERLAAAFLIAKGWEQIKTNYRLAGGEIDLLMRDAAGTLVVVEVKTRLSSDFAQPQVNVTSKKRSTLYRLARTIADRYPNTDVRVDLVEVVLSSRQIHHLTDILN